MGDEDLDFLVGALCGEEENNPGSVSDIDLFSVKPSAKQKIESDRISPIQKGSLNLINSTHSFSSFLSESISKYSKYGQDIKNIMKSQSGGTKRKWTGLLYCLISVVFDYLLY